MIQFPVSIHIGPYTILLHAIMETAAFMIGFRYFFWLRKKQGDTFSSSTRSSIIIGAIFGALIGSRLIGSLERPNELLMTHDLLDYIYNNKTVVGGFLGGLFGVEIAKKIMGENRASGDLFVYPMILALIIGRIGCFSMGVYEETYGSPTTLPWGMNLGDGVSRHPVDLYEMDYLVLLWIGLKSISKKYTLENGALFKMFMIGYLAFRFLLDFIKPHVTYGIGLSTIQYACLGGLIYYLPYLLHPKKLTVHYA